MPSEKVEITDTIVGKFVQGELGFSDEARTIYRQAFEDGPTRRAIQAVVVAEKDPQKLKQMQKNVAMGLHLGHREGTGIVMPLLDRSKLLPEVRRIYEQNLGEDYPYETRIP